jgi:hypothetical protein
MPNLDKLNGMVDLFTVRDNGKLDAGEVDALATFYDGLGPSGRQGIKPRLIEIYQKSQYSTDQKDRFYKLLNGYGFTRSDFEGRELSTAWFLALTPEKQLEYLREAGAKQSEFMILSDIEKKVREKIEDELAAQKKLLKEKRSDITYEFGIRKWNAVRLPEKPSGTGDIVGCSIYWVITADGQAQVDRKYYFTVDGKYLGEEYKGE